MITEVDYRLTKKLATLIGQWDSIVCDDHGLVHNENGPALISNRSIYWVRQGLYHREGDLPAVINVNLGSSWWINGKLHRIDGPAQISINGDKLYYLNGTKLSEEDWRNETAKIKLKRILDL